MSATIASTVEPKRGGRRKCGQQARPSTIFVESTIYFPSVEFGLWDKVPQGSVLISEDTRPELSYKTV